MVIDTHIRPALYAPICGDEKRFQQRCDEMNYHLMNPSDIKLLKKQYALADIQKAFRLYDICGKYHKPVIFHAGLSLISQCMLRGKNRATEIIQQFNPYK